MKVLFVCNNLYAKGNGLCTSANVTVMYLREAGVDVRFLAGENKDPNGPQPDYPLPFVYVPIFQPIIDSNGFCFARCKKDVITEAVQWADVIHIEEPFILQHQTIRIAEKLHKPLVGTFHLYPNNVFGEFPIPIWGKLFNGIYMKYWQARIFDHLSDIQCPSREVKRVLQKFNFKAKLHVISNGIRIPEERVIAEPLQTPPFVVLSIGRLTQVKDQRTLLEAMRYSKHANQIQLHLAGNGADKEHLQKMCDELVKDGVLEYKPIFGFYTHAQLKGIAKGAYLFVHSARLEVEGLGCIEALREGTVPIISKGELIGTSDFALDERSLFPARDPRTLAEKIDWWIEHPEERNEMAQKYADFARTYDVRKSIAKLIEMYKGAIKR